MATDKREKELDVQATALLASQGLNQRNIAAALGISQAGVSRLLRLAIKKGWLQTSTRFVRKGITNQRLEEIQLRIFPLRLMARFRALPEKSGEGALRAIYIFHSGGEGTTAKEWDQRLEQFGRAAAGCVLELIRHSDVTGVSWGQTTASLVKGLRELGLEGHRPPRPVQFVPITGDPLGRILAEYSASNLASQLDEIVNGGSSHSPSLGAVPALIPLVMQQDEIRAIRTLMTHIPAYREIFGDGGDGGDHPYWQPWISRLDTILTGAGSSAQRPWFWSKDVANIGSIDIDQLLQLVVGDLAGILIRKPEQFERIGARQKARPAIPDLIDQIEDRWLGIKREHLVQCVRKASGSDRPGVVLLAIGENKSTCVYEMIRMGLINTLVIDHDLAYALDKLLPKSPGQREET